MTRPCESSSCSADCSPPCSPCGTTCLSEREVLISQRIQVKHPGWVLQPLQFIHLHKNLILSLRRLGFMRSAAPSARWWDQGIFFLLFVSKRWDCPATDPVQSDLSYVERFVVKMMMCVFLSPRPRFARMIQNKTSTETVKGFARFSKS